LEPPNIDALNTESQAKALSSLAEAMGKDGRVRVLLHSIAFGNLKPLAPVHPRVQARKQEALNKLAAHLNLQPEVLQESIDRLLADGQVALHGLSSCVHGNTVIEDEDMSRTIHAMGTSLLSWVQGLFSADLFAKDARVFGLTSEGRDTSWLGYAAVAAAKAALESICKAISVEFGPYGVRCNILQPGITDTPALRLIPGNLPMKASAELRNPLGRLTRPEDVAKVISLLSTDDAAWVNGTLIHVDGGEHNAAG
jgi:NAD(P)-dependent dehydrogenase (short-subunit alcohol dehydrogenase family)